MTSGQIMIRQQAPDFSQFDIVERKGRGHPDTLSDQLAVRLSREYSQYTRENYGAILHHNFDKVGILGGHSRAEFGDGDLTSPLRVLLNGRASTRFGDEDIPVREILIPAINDFLLERFPMLDPETDITVHNNLSAASSPGETEPDQFKDEGARAHWFTPRSLDDLPERKKLVANDTSHGVAYAPLNPIEQFTYDLEKYLNGPFSEDNPWLGNDIKLMCQRTEQHVELTIAVPQIADHVPDIETYDTNLQQIEAETREFADDVLPDYSFNVYTNNRDDYDAGELYLTAIGSAIESGDEGLVGRGNRVNGLITPTRPMSIEGHCGKNPVYHVGMLYNLAARRVAEALHSEFSVCAEVHLISQTGRKLTDPWKTLITVDESIDQETATDVVRSELGRIPEITDDWLAGKIQMV